MDGRWCASRAPRCASWCRRCTATSTPSGSTALSSATARRSATGSETATPSTPIWGLNRGAVHTPARRACFMAASPTIRRFTATERGLHWTHAISFLLLLLTGCFLYFPALSELAGNLRIAHLTILNVHMALGAFYIGGPPVWGAPGEPGGPGRHLHPLRAG